MFKKRHYAGSRSDARSEVASVRSVPSSVRSGHSARSGMSHRSHMTAHTEMSFRGADMGQAEMRFIGARNHIEEENPLDIVALNLNKKNRHIEKRDFAGLRDNYQSVKTKFGGVQNLDKVNHLSFEQKESLLYFDEIVRGMSGSLLENKIYYESADEDDYLAYGSSSKDKKHRRKQDRRDRHEKRRRESRKQHKTQEGMDKTLASGRDRDRRDRDRDRDEDRKDRKERGTSRSRRGRCHSSYLVKFLMFSHRKLLKFG